MITGCDDIIDVMQSWLPGTQQLRAHHKQPIPVCDDIIDMMQSWLPGTQQLRAHHKQPIPVSLDCMRRAASCTITKL